MPRIKAQGKKADTGSIDSLMLDHFVLEKECFTVNSTAAHEVTTW
ncbi:hypothetical protein [Pseudaquabacterium terrae]|nr:hypothetical protein [Aquabacterium terrae]